MFYSDLGRNLGRADNIPPKIERAYMDGTHRLKLSLSKIYGPTGLTVDAVNRRVYWTDSKFDHLETVDYDGRFRYMVINTLIVF